MSQTKAPKVKGAYAYAAGMTFYNLEKRLPQMEKDLAADTTA